MKKLYLRYHDSRKTQAHLHFEKYIVMKGKNKMAAISSNLTIENARIIFRNFSGKESQFNRAGARNFCVLIDDPEIAGGLVSDGWNVKYTHPQDEQEEPIPYIQVAVSYANVPPKIVLVTESNRVELTEETVSTLDYAIIENVDLIVSPYHWEMGGKKGVKGYLRTMYVTIEEDAFANKYGM